MNGHDRFRVLLPLAASGDLSPEELRQLREHLAACAECRRAGGEFEALAGGLRGLPTPQPGAELLARVHSVAEAALVRQRTWREDAGTLAPLVAASWIATVATWPLVREATAWVIAGWHLPGGELGTVLGAYSALGLPLACAAAIAVGMRARTTRRTR